MKFRLLLIILVLLSTNVIAQGESDPVITKFLKANGQQIPILNFEQLEARFTPKNDTTYIFNFWATWCIPCVQELPYFEQLLSTYPNEKLKIILVSLDFPKQVNKSSIPFLRKKDIQANMILLDDKDANTWINKVNPNWSGALPATLILNKKQRLFYEKSFNFEELEKAYLKAKK